MEIEQRHGKFQKRKKISDKVFFQEKEDFSRFMFDMNL